MTESTDKPLLDKDLAEEQQLEEYLKGDSSVSRQYRQLQNADVPAELDRLVLRQAEDAVKKPSTTRPVWVRWTAPLAVAASAVIVLSIVLEHGVRDATVQEMASRSSAPTQAEVRKHAERKAEQAAPAPPKIASPPPPKVDLPSEAPTNAIQMTTTVRPAAPPPVAAPAPTPEGAMGESVARSADVATQVLQPAAPAAVANEQAREQERSDTKAYSKRINAEMPAAAPATVYSDPEAWLRDIRQLRKDNKQEQADSEWRRFRIAFPGYAVAETDTAREAKK